MKMRNLVLPQAPAVESPEALPISTLDLTGLTPFDNRLNALMPQLVHLDDAQLLQLATHARQLEACAFRLRGACVAELRRRVTLRLTGGRGRRDTTGSGISAQLARLATQVGVSVWTLKTDARIHEIFFKGETSVARDTTLPREYYVIAMGGIPPDPLMAIQTAYERCSDPGYKREQFRRDVRALKPATQAAASAVAVVTSTVNSTSRLRVKILPEAEDALTDLINLNGQTPETIVAEALLAYHKSLIAHPTDAPKASGSSTDGRRTTARKPTRFIQPQLPLSP